MKFKKNTFWNILILFGCLILSACSKEDNAKDPAPRLQVDKIQLSVIQSGRLTSGSKATLNILANIGYEITSDVSWITVDKPAGKGRTDVVLDIEENTTGDTRAGHLTISSMYLQETVTVVQTMDIDTDDGQTIGFVYLEDDFSWCEPFGGEDEIKNQTSGKTINANTLAAAKETLNSRGYEDINSGGNCFYLGKHYFKMGKTNYQTGVRLNGIPNIEEGKTTSVRLKFNATPIRSGSGNYDNVQVIVEIEGAGTVGNGSQKISKEISLPIPNGAPWIWLERSVDLFGINAQSKITLKTTKSGTDAGTFRWSLNDIKIEKIPAN